MSTTTSSTPSTPTTNATFSLYEQSPAGSLPLFIVEGLAFLAILRRDLVVAKREFIGNLIQAMVVPGFFLFIFGRVLPQTGVASPGYAALLLPGMVAM